MELSPCRSLKISHWILPESVFLPTYQSPEVHEARDVGDGDDDVDHDEYGRDEVRQEEQRGQEHA